MKMILPTLLGVALLISPQLASALSITPATVITLATDPPVIADIHPINDGSVVPPSQQRPQISPPKFASNDKGPQQEQQILPVLLNGPLQPSSDMLPPVETLDDNDGSFVNTKTKRQNDIQSQNGQARFLIPGVNWGWTGIIGANADEFTYIAGEPGSVEVKDGSCPATPPISSYLLTCQLQECEEDANCFGPRKCCRFHCAFICVHPVFEVETGGNANYEKPGSCYRPGNDFGSGSGYYPRNYRSRRQVPGDNNQVFYADDSNNGPSTYYTNGNGGGFGGGNNPGGNYPGGNYPGGQHGGNGGGSSYCYRDRDCPGNKKCCSRLCRTPAYIG